MTPLTQSLVTTHRKLDEEIHRLLKMRAPDTLRLLRLKKRRLAVKDRMHRLIDMRPREMA